MIKIEKMDDFTKKKKYWSRSYFHKMQVYNSLKNQPPEGV